MIGGDETGVLYGEIWNGRFFIHSMLVNPEALDTVRHYRIVLQELEEHLMARGISEYYTMADSVLSYKYNKLFGFNTTYEVIDNKYEIMVKQCQRSQ
jgi:hypothetical protein